MNIKKKKSISDKTYNNTYNGVFTRESNYLAQFYRW